MTRQSTSVPAQQQQPPGSTAEMTPPPRDEMRDYEGNGLLRDKRALITGGDSGIGRAVGAAFAKEGADVAIVYFGDSEDEDARHTAGLVTAQQRRCSLHKGDLGSRRECEQLVTEVAGELGGIDVLVNHAGTQAVESDFTEITDEQFDRTLSTSTRRSG